MSVKAASLQALAALSARDMPRPQFGNVPYGRQITTCTSPGKIALTFDDGPSIYTQGIVDTLEKNGAKGTFYIVGSNGESGLENTQYHPMVKKIAASGHQIAHHSWSHPYFTQIGVNGIITEMTKLEALFIQVLGFTPTYFRPPYTDCAEECWNTLGTLGYHVTDYNLDTLDWDPTWAHREEFTKAITSSNPASDSKIVLSHDIQEFTATTGFVQFMIDTARAQGYTQFVTVGECLGDPAANWYRDPTTGGPISSQPPTDPTTKPPTDPTTKPPTDPTTKPPTDVTTPPPETTTKPTTTRYTNTTITRTDTTLTTICPEPTPEPTGCKGRTCQETSGEPHPSKTRSRGHSYTTTGSGPSGTTTGKPSSSSPVPVQVNGAVTRAAGSAHVVALTLAGALAWLAL